MTTHRTRPGRAIFDGRCLRFECAVLVLAVLGGCANLLGFEEAGPLASAAVDESMDSSIPNDRAIADASDAQGDVALVDGGPVDGDVEPGPGGPLDLLRLDISNGQLEPDFDRSVLSYRLELGLDASELRVTPTAASSGIAITVQGTPVESGRPSNPIPLALGETEVQIVLESPDEATRKTYRIRVDRASGILQQTYVKASDTHHDDQFGTRVALSGGTLVVGAPFEDGESTGINGDRSEGNGFAQNSGAAYVFVREGASWLQQAYLKASNARAEHHFGGSVAISGDTVAIGASLESSGWSGVDGDQDDRGAPGSGAVYVFERVGGSWGQTAYLKPSNTQEGMGFGSSLSLQGDLLAVGAPGENSGQFSFEILLESGAAYVFGRRSGSWAEQAFIKPANPGASDRFGTSVALSGSFLLIGAPGEDSNAAGVNGNPNNDGSEDSGAAYLFQSISLEPIVAPGDEVWPQVAYLKSSHPAPGAGFGGSVAMDGDLFAVGAPGESSDATGVSSGSGGDQSNTRAPDSGAVYVFGHEGEEWIQWAYVKPSNTASGDEFGSALGLWAGVLAVGAPGEDRSGLGLDTLPSNDESTDSGAVYLFTRTGSSFLEQVSIKASNTGDGDRFGLALALDHGELAVAAPFEDSGAVVVNGEEVDDSAAESGAVYVRQLMPSPDRDRSQLTELFLVDADLEAEFAASEYDYWATVPASQGEISVVARTVDPGAELTIAGNLEVPGEPSAPIALGPGETKIEIGVLASDGRYSVYEVRVNQLIELSDEIPLDVAAASPWSAMGMELGCGYSENTTRQAVAVSGNTLVVGVPFDDSDVRGTLGTPTNSSASDSGAVYVFVREPSGNWRRQAYLKADNADPYDYFGWSVALSGDVLVVGAPNEASATMGANGSGEDNSAPGAGAAYVFVRSGSSWHQQAYLKAINAVQYDEFGTSVAAYGNQVLVGAPREGNSASGVQGDPRSGVISSSGAAYLFVREGTVWRDSVYFKASNPSDDARFGHSVALDEDTLVVGAKYEGSASTGINGSQVSSSWQNGAVYVFRLEGTSWAQEAFIKPWNLIDSKYFGTSIALSGNTLAVGAPSEASSATRVNGDPYNREAAGSGAVYVFERAMWPPWKVPLEERWRKQAYLKAANAHPGDQFGSSVSLEGGVLAVGAPCEDGTGGGVRAAERIDSGSERGAVYLFVRREHSWSQNAYLKATQPVQYLGLGGAVFLTEDRLAVGNWGWLSSLSSSDPEIDGVVRVYER